MNIKKKIHWIGIFSVLTLFTFYTVTGLFRNNTLEAYASTISKENINSNKVVIFGDNLSKDSVIKKITRLYENEVLCVVNEEQYDYLSSIYATDKEILEIDGKDVNLLKIFDDKNANSNKIIDYIVSTSDDSKCKVVKSKKWLYMIFSAHLS